MMGKVHASIILLVVLAVIGCVFSSPIQEESLRQDGHRPVQYLGRYYDDRGRSSKRNLDQIGGGNLLKRAENGAKYPPYGGVSAPRNLDHIGGGNLLRRSVDFSEDGVPAEIYSRSEIQDPYHKREESTRYARNLDPIGGGNLVRRIDQNEEKPVSVVQTEDGIFIRYD